MVRGLAQIDILVPSGQSEKTLSYDFSGLGKVLMTRGAQCRALAEPGIGRPREREMAQDIVSFLDESLKN